MAKKIFVNLPVKNLEKSKAFYTAIGFSINPQFSDETAACVVISEDIYVMILTHDKFRQFTSKEIADTSKTIQVITALLYDSRAEVDDVYEKAAQGGGAQARPTEDLGFMYTRSFIDPDGHLWEPFYMDMSSIPQDPHK